MQEFPPTPGFMYHGYEELQGCQGNWFLTMLPKSKRRHSEDAKHLNVASPNPNSCKDIKMENVGIQFYFASAHVLQQI